MAKKLKIEVVPVSEVPAPSNEDGLVARVLVGKKNGMSIMGGDSAEIVSSLVSQRTGTHTHSSGNEKKNARD
jgi:hypothetical protein